MPELPEVETVRLGLESSVLGNTISCVLFFDIGRGIAFDPSSLFGLRFSSFRRHGKYLMLDFDNGSSMISHLRMTGQYIPVNAKRLDSLKRDGFDKHTRVVFCFDDGSGLLFNDQRKFGTMEIMNTFEVESYFSSRKLGDDALLINEENFVSSVSRRKNVALKTALLDQTVIAGLGNIYAMELCYLVAVDPRRPVSLVSKKTLLDLHTQIKPLLLSALKHKGTTFDGKYVNTNGNAGEFSDFLFVYGQKICKKCGDDIVKIKLNGRGTYYCPRCQK